MSCSDKELVIDSVWGGEVNTLTRKFYFSFPNTMKSEQKQVGVNNSKLFSDFTALCPPCRPSDIPSSILCCTCGCPHGVQKLWIEVVLKQTYKLSPSVY